MLKFTSNFRFTKICTRKKYFRMSITQRVLSVSMTVNPNDNQTSSSPLHVQKKVLNELYLLVSSNYYFKSPVCWFRNSVYTMFIIDTAAITRIKISLKTCVKIPHAVLEQTQHSHSTSVYCVRTDSTQIDASFAPTFHDRFSIIKCILIIKIFHWNFWNKKYMLRRACTNICGYCPGFKSDERPSKGTKSYS